MKLHLSCAAIYIDWYILAPERHHFYIPGRENDKTIDYTSGFSKMRWAGQETKGTVSVFLFVLKWLNFKMCTMKNILHKK